MSWAPALPWIPGPIVCFWVAQDLGGSVRRLRRLNRDMIPAMSMDIHQDLFGPDGDGADETASRQYVDDLVTLFEESPEAKALAATKEKGWVWAQVQLGIDHLGVTPPTTRAVDLIEILFEIFPRKVTVEPTEAPRIVSELAAFWTFLDRAFGLDNAAENLEVLSPETSQQMEHELSDPENWGPAKRFAMFAQAMDFDIQAEEGRAVAMQAYNSSLEPPFTDGSRSRAAASPQNTVRDARRAKNRRKAARNSRKKNRKKK